MKPESQTHDVSRLPYLTGELAGVGGQYKTAADDFFVEERPLYAFSGKGTHVYALMEKTGMSTANALAAIAGALNRKPRDIGFAGLKDAHAVTRQWISIEHLDSRILKTLSFPNIQFLEIHSHTNKIKLGHLAGNRFRIRIRNLTAPRDTLLSRTEGILAVLQKRGVPNYFGPQRFGNHGDSHLLGYALLKGRIEEFMDLFLGNPKPGDVPPVQKARQLYEQRQYAKAYSAWPYSFREHRRLLRALMQKNATKKKAYYRLDISAKKFLINAWQSSLFNEVLASRLQSMDRLLAGDMAWKHDNGSCFRVEDPAAEQPRCDRFEISPTGPIFGFRMTELTGPAAEIESPILAAAEVTARDFRQMGQYGVRGSRRPLRFPLRGATAKTGSDSRGDYLELGFTLDAGCYATSVLREVMKSQPSLDEETP